MNRLRLGFITVTLLALGAFAPGCGSDDTAESSSTSGTDPGDGGGSHASMPPAGDSGASKPPGDAAADGSDGSSPASVADPSLDGPFAYAEKDASTTITATGDNVDVHVAYPTAPGSYPVVVFGHGFQLATSQYFGYLKRLASHGYVALTVDYPNSLTANNPNQAKDLLGGIDWAKSDPTVGSRVDASKAATSGHSLGGKLALLAATLDARVKAALVLDPVDGGGPLGCTPPGCVTVANAMPTLKIPTGLLGETTDAASSGLGQACAPAASNFQTFYAKASSPSLEITIAGANHMSFLDDVASCGLTCAFCNTATAPDAQVRDLAKAYLVAFFERHVRGKLGYDAYLTGNVAQARYVATGQATIAAK